MAMVLNPDIQREAQESVDAIVGHDRLPDLSDRGSIPWVNALMMESLRLYPVTPLGK